jgi:CRP-like cAMP-binding protein
VELAAPPTPHRLPSALRAATHRFRCGDLLTAATAPAHCAYLIQSGHVRVFRVRGGGRETTTALLGPGYVVGIGALVGLPAYQCFAQAQTAVDAWVLYPGRLWCLLARQPELACDVVALLSRRLAWSEAVLRDVVLLPVPERVRNLRRRLESCGGPPPRLTREALAEVVAARRETISRALSPRAGTGARAA